MYSKPREEHKTHTCDMEKNKYCKERGGGRGGERKPNDAALTTETMTKEEQL